MLSVSSVSKAKRMEVNNVILSFTFVTTEEVEDTDLTETAASSFATSIILGGGGGLCWHEAVSRSQR